MKDKISLFTFDTAFHDLTTRALDQAINMTGATDVIVMSDRDFYPGSRWIYVDSISRCEYNKILFNKLHDIVKTEYVMIIQHDGMPIDDSKWDDSFLNHDYIGAIWPWLPEGRNVGNGGFSIRSKKLLDYCANLEFPISLSKTPQEDALICQDYRPLLESKGITFAPSSLATKFSHEFPHGRFDTYGFHGELCLPYYLSDNHLEFYIQHMPSLMFKDMFRISNIFLGLYKNNRYDHLHLLIEQGIGYISDFKNIITHEASRGIHRFSDISKFELENLLINY
jgi:hypothetical protein